MVAVLDVRRWVLSAYTQEEWAFMGDGDRNSLNDATERLASALKAMEDAVASKRHSDLTVESLEEQLQTLEQSLDAERQRGERLESVNDDVTERIESIIESIRDMLEDD